MIRTADGIDHGGYILRDCVNAVLEVYEDGYMLCALLASGGICEECMDVLEERADREDRTTKPPNDHGGM